MTRNEAHKQARNNEIRFSILIENSTGLTPTQRAWMSDIYSRLELAYAFFTATETSMSRHSDWRVESQLREYYQESRVAQSELLDKVDVAYQRVFDPGPEFEPAFQHCDGEITFACAEAMYRLRVIALYKS